MIHARRLAFPLAAILLSLVIAGLFALPAKAAPGTMVIGDAKLTACSSGTVKVGSCLVEYEFGPFRNDGTNHAVKPRFFGDNSIRDIDPSSYEVVKYQKLVYRESGQPAPAGMEYMSDDENGEFAWVDTKEIVGVGSYLAVVKAVPGTEFAEMSTEPFKVYSSVYGYTFEKCVVNVDENAELIADGDNLKVTVSVYDSIEKKQLKEGVDFRISSILFYGKNATMNDAKNEWDSATPPIQVSAPKEVGCYMLRLEGLGTYAGASRSEPFCVYEPDETEDLNKEVISAKTLKPFASRSTVTLGPDVRKIAPNAFANTKVKKVVIRSRNLKKSTVKNCFKGSGVKTVKVQVKKTKATKGLKGKKLKDAKAYNKKAKAKNKKIAAKYKKFFTKKVVGKKVKVKA